MKNLIIINGTMGVGKSTVCKELNKRLIRSVWLDGDWCWMMNPWVVNDENKKMVVQNINFLLRNFLNNSGFSYVIFDWVIHTDSIMNTIIQGLSDCNFKLFKISLTCREEELIARMNKDGRTNIQTSIDRLKLYQDMDTIKVDTSNKSVNDIANEIVNIISC